MKWGLPKSIRIDNGAPMGDPQRKRIPELALWLIGMNINVIFNRPRRPTDNAKVERMQRTTKNWADIKNCKNIEQLKEQLSAAISIQREHFKVSRLGNKTRLESFPELLSNTRKYSKDDFDVHRAYQRLAQWQFVRQVSKTGQFSLYGQVYYIGTKLAKQYVAIKFNVDAIRWEVSDSNGNSIKNILVKNMTTSHMQNLTIGQRTKSLNQ